MDINQLRFMLIDFKLKLEELRKTRSHVSGTDYSIFLNLLNLSHMALPEHEAFFENFHQEIIKSDIYREIARYSAEGFCDYVIELIDYELNTKKQETEGKLFLGSQEKIKEACKSFEKEDRPGVFNNLNTSVELMLKDKLNIPTTYTKIDTVNIIDLLIKNEIGPLHFLREVKERCCQIDNDVKHRGFIPTEPQCVKAIKSVQSLEKELEKTQLNLTKDIEDKLFTRKYLISSDRGGN